MFLEDGKIFPNILYVITNKDEKTYENKMMITSVTNCVKQGLLGSTLGMFPISILILLGVISMVHVKFWVIMLLVLSFITIMIINSNSILELVVVLIFVQGQ